MNCQGKKGPVRKVAASRTHRPPEERLSTHEADDRTVLLSEQPVNRGQIFSSTKRERRPLERSTN
jgi:hypothetical protein